MKRFKLLNILLILAFVFMMPVVHAHEVTLNNDSIKITSVEGKIYSGSKITVDAEKLGITGDYKVYYQYVIIENDDYKSYDDKVKEQNEYIENFLEENNLTDINDASSDLISTYNTAVKAYEEEKEEILPSFVESNWIETTDATAKLDLTKVPENELGYQPYVLWIKVTSNDTTTSSFYGDQVVLATRQVEDPELKEENASTGDKIMWVALGAVALAGIMIVSYKKVNA